MPLQYKPFLTIVAAGLLSLPIGLLSAAADEAAVEPGATTEVTDSAAATTPAVPDAAGEAAAVAPESATDETSSEVAPSSGTGTAEEPPFSVMPSEGPGGGCHRHRAEQPSV